jgi:hypothetical protein
MSACKDCGFEREFCVCRALVSSPQAVWEQIGEEGRRKLDEQVASGFAPNRKSSATLVIVSNGRCAPHPLEQIARDWGCVCNVCNAALGPLVFLLEAKPQLHDALAHGAMHGPMLVRAFLSSPDLMYPPDIPAYALRCWEFIQRQQKAQAAIEERKARMAATQLAFAAAYQGKK